MRRISSAKAILILSVLLTGGLAATLAMVAASPQGRDKTRDSEFEKEGIGERDGDFTRKHTDGSGKVRLDLWRKGIEDYKRMRIGASMRSARDESFAAGGVTGVQWKQVGPGPLQEDSNASRRWAGEVTDIAIDPRNTTDQVIYIAANDGGIWKSTDGGANWKAKTDSMPSLSMGSVALDPGNPSIVYAGTGNIFNNGFFKGVGVYRSIDAGETWTIINPG